MLYEYFTMMFWIMTRFPMKGKDKGQIYNFLKLEFYYIFIKDELYIILHDAYFNTIYSIYNAI